MTDPISDYLTRLRNAIKAGHKVVDIPASSLKKEMTKLLKEKGYILNYKFEDEVGYQGNIKIALKYNPETKISAIKKIPVNGACKTPAINPPIPINAKLLVLICRSPNKLTTWAKSIPVFTPINNVGAKIPPTPPAPKVNDVATIFSNITEAIKIIVTQISSRKL